MFQKYKTSIDETHQNGLKIGTSSIPLSAQVPVPPILGFYQLKEEETQWKFSVHLKLHESVKNTFEYCEARVPFFNQ